MVETEKLIHAVVLWCVVLLIVALAPSYSEAASCSSSEKEALEEEYDDLVVDFDELLEDREIYRDLRGIEAEIQRDDRVRESAVRLALRSVKRELRDVEDDAEDWHLGFLDLVKKSRYEDCEEEIKEFAEKFLVYTEDEIDTLQEKLDDIEEKMKGITFSSASFGQIRAPVWGDEDEGKQQTEERVPATPTTESTAPSSEEILKKIRKVMQELKELFAQYVAAKQREQS